MYEKHFGLRRRPFRPTPDSEGYYPATTHEQALSRLIQGIQQDEGFLLLTGPTGMGKTLLCHRLLEQLGPQTVSAYLTNCRCRDRTSLLQAILYELSRPYEGLSEQLLRLALTEVFLENFKAGKRSLLLVDEAQHLPADLLEELRLLGNLEAAHGKAVQVVLIGLPTLLETLGQPDLVPLRQRIAVRVELEPFGPEETADYVLHQLRLAGARPESILAEEALTLLAQAAHGIPRLLNQAAHQALQLATQADQTQVDVEAVLEALALLGMSPAEPVVAEASAVAEESEEEACDLRPFQTARVTMPARSAG